MIQQNTLVFVLISKLSVLQNLSLIKWYCERNNYCLICMSCCYAQCYHLTWIDNYLGLKQILNHTCCAGVTVDTGKNTVTNHMCSDDIKLHFAVFCQIIEFLLLRKTKKVDAYVFHFAGYRTFFTKRTWQFHFELQETTEGGNVSDSHQSERINQSQVENSNSGTFKFDLTVKSDVIKSIIGCFFNPGLRMRESTEDASFPTCTTYHTLVMRLKIITTQISTLKFLLQNCQCVYKLYFAFHQRWRKICFTYLCDQLRQAPY